MLWSERPSLLDGLRRSRMRSQNLLLSADISSIVYGRVRRSSPSCCGRRSFAVAL